MSIITCISFWWNHSITYFFHWNPFLKTDAASFLNLFSAKNPKQDSMKIIMEQFQNKMMDAKLDNKQRKNKVEEHGPSIYVMYP